MLELSQSIASRSKGLDRPAAAGSRVMRTEIPSLTTGRVLKMAARAAIARGKHNLQNVASLWAHAAHDLRQPLQGALLVTRMLETESIRLPQKRAARHIAM